MTPVIRIPIRLFSTPSRMTIHPTYNKKKLYKNNYTDGKSSYFYMYKALIDLNKQREIYKQRNNLI